MDCGCEAGGGGGGEASKLMMVHFDPISSGKPQNDYLYKTALRCRLLM